MRNSKEYLCAGNKALNFLLEETRGRINRTLAIIQNLKAQINITDDDAYRNCLRDKLDYYRKMINMYQFLVRRCKGDLHKNNNLLNKLYNKHNILNCKNGK